jgi:hypothetical protein
MNRTIRVELEPLTRMRVLGLKGRCREWVSRVPARTSTDSQVVGNVVCGIYCNIQTPIITITPGDMHGPTKPPLLQYQLKNVSEDESREVVKGHTWCTSLLLCTTFLPARRTELSAFWRALKGCSLVICYVHVNSITPPFLNAI